MFFDLPSSRFLPVRYRPGNLGNWSGHLPFARDLIEAIRPAITVELGTQFGESYFGFCQSLEESRTQAKTFAIDTWIGDENSGPYGEEVYEDVRLFNERHYGAFSALLRCTFDEAAESFADGSIDLLHIDGRHSYEAVRHDFETWLPKVRPGGIILFHDVEVRTGDFGVWRLWEELTHAYPSFRFVHSCGLGVIRKSGGPVSGFTHVLFGSPGKSDGIRAYYELCADRLQSRFEMRQSRLEVPIEFRLQLFWRQEGHDFSENESISRYAKAGEDRQEIVLKLPVIDPPPYELRLDLKRFPGVMMWSRVSLEGAAGTSLWNPKPSGLVEACSTGVHLAAMDNTLLVHAGEAVGSVLLPIDPAALSGVDQGGMFRLEVCGLSMNTAIPKLISAANESRKQGKAAQHLQSAYQEAARLAFARARELKDYADALATAQKLVAERDEHIQRLTSAYEQAAALALGREQELKDYAQALQKAESLIFETTRGQQTE
jgi:hypothetical protein